MNTKQYVPAAIFLSIAVIIAGYFIGNALVKAKKHDRSVIVKGLAEREVMADMAIWPIKITSTSNELSEIERNFEQSFNVVESYLREKGINDDEISRGLPTIFDTKADRYQSNQYGTTNRYIGNFTIIVRTSNMVTLDAAIKDVSKLIGKGIVLDQDNYWQKVEYLYTSLNEIKPEMIEEATKNARIAAEKFAVDSESKVGKIKQANQGLFSITNRDMNSPQIKKVRVVSTIEFYLND